jgi:DNA repair exonuclease SbcCD ATPase subunit
MLQHKTQEEDKLAKLLTDKQSLNNHHEESQALESAMEMLKRLEADAQKMETVQQNFPKKQEDFIKLYETLKDYATRWRELNVREQMLESGEQNQKEFANIESDRKELVSLIEECIERITKGYEVLQRYQENFDDVNDVLLCVLRGDKQSMTKLFGQPPKSIKEMGLDDLWIEIQAINSEVKRGFTKIPILIDTIPQIATNQFVSPRSPRLATPTTPRSENFDEERKELQKKIDSLEQELNKKKIMFDSVTRDRKKLENEVKLLSEQNLKLRKLAEGETSPSPRSNSLTKHSPRPTNSPKGKETEEMKILRVTVQQLSQKNERLQKELEASKERDEQDKLQLSKNQSIVDSLNNQIKKLMENTSKEVQITLEQNGVEKEKVSKLEAEVESLQKTVQGLTEKLKESAPVQSTGKKDLDTMLLQEMTKEMDQMKQKYETEIANLKSILERPKQKPVVPSLTLNTSDSDISHQPFAARMELFKGLDQTPKGNDSSRVKAMKSGRKTDEKLREEVQELRKIVERYKSESKLKQ